MEYSRSSKYVPDLAGLDKVEDKGLAKLLRRNLEMISGASDGSGAVNLQTAGAGGQAPSPVDDTWRGVTEDSVQKLVPTVDRDVVRIGDRDAGITEGKLTVIPDVGGTAIKATGLSEIEHVDSTSLTADTLTLNPMSSVAHQEGLLWYNEDRKVFQIYTDIPGTAGDLTEETRFRAVNKSGSTVLNGQPVFINGAQGAKTIVALASALPTMAYTDRVVGLATMDIPNNGEGYVTTEGTVHAIDTSAYPEGTYLFLSETAGQLTTTPPLQPSVTTLVGIVEYQHANQGEILVAVRRQYARDLRQIDKTSTGWAPNAGLDSYYDYTTRKVTVTNNGAVPSYAFWQGEVLVTLQPGQSYISDAHGLTGGKWFLYYNGSAWTWSQTPWTFDLLMSGFVYYNASSPVDSYGVTETHSLMDPSSHEEFHQVNGTYKTAGGTFSGYTLGSYTSADRQVDIGSITLKDEDCVTVNALLNGANGAYTLAYIAAGGVFTFVSGQDHVVVNGATTPTWNNPATGALTALGNNQRMNAWVISIPVMKDAQSQKKRYVLLAGQIASTNANVVAGEDPNNLNLGDLSSLSAEWNISGRIQLQYNTGLGWMLESVSEITGTRTGSVSTAVTGLSAVAHDATLSGDGTAGDPLGVTPLTYAPYSHASATTDHGIPSGTNYGHVRFTSSLPVMDGTASAGTTTTGIAATYNHRHPTDTSRLAVTDAATTYVPYTGATGSVQLGQNDLYTNAIKIQEGVGNVLVGTLDSAGGSNLTLTNNTGGYNASVELGPTGTGRLRNAYAPYVEVTPNSATITDGTRYVLVDSQGVKPTVGSGTTANSVLSLDANGAIQKGSLTAANVGAAATVHVHAWGDITSGKPTTLAGYGITDAVPYTGATADLALGSRKLILGTVGGIRTEIVSNGSQAYYDTYGETAVFRGNGTVQLTSNQAGGGQITLDTGGIKLGNVQGGKDAAGLLTLTGGIVKMGSYTYSDFGAAASSHNHSWSNITSGLPTTIAGYGITDAVPYTGAASNVNLGAYDLTADLVSAARNVYAGTTSSTSARFEVTGSSTISAFTELNFDTATHVAQTRLINFNESYSQYANNFTMWHNGYHFYLNTSGLFQLGGTIAQQNANTYRLQVVGDINSTTGLREDGTLLSDKYAAIAHTHTGVYEPANANIQSHISSTSNPHSTTVSNLTDTVIEVTKADNELLAWNSVTSKWINQTAAEAGVATATHTQAVNAGGTNITSYAVGDMLYASATTTLAKISPNTTTVKQYLSMTGTGAVGAMPLWSALVAADVTDLSTTLAAYLPLAGGTMTGSVSMAGYNITNGNAISGFGSVSATNIYATSSVYEGGSTLASKYVPYTGATNGVNLGTFPLAASLLTASYENPFVTVLNTTGGGSARIQHVYNALEDDALVVTMTDNIGTAEVMRASLLDGVLGATTIGGSLLNVPSLSSSGRMSGTYCNSTSISGGMRWLDESQALTSSLVSPWWSDDFLSSTNTGVFTGSALASGTVTSVDSGTNNWGTVAITSSASANSGYSYNNGNSAAIRLNVASYGAKGRFSCIFYPQHASNLVRMGFANTFGSTEPTFGLYLRVLGTAAALYSNGAAISGETATISLNTWYRFDLRQVTDTTCEWSLVASNLGPSWNPATNTSMTGGTVGFGVWAHYNGTPGGSTNICRIDYCGAGVLAGTYLDRR